MGALDYLGALLTEQNPGSTARRCSVFLGRVNVRIPVGNRDVMALFKLKKPQGSSVHGQQHACKSNFQGGTSIGSPADSDAPAPLYQNLFILPFLHSSPHALQLRRAHFKKRFEDFQWLAHTPPYFSTSTARFLPMDTDVFAKRCFKALGAFAAENGLDSDMCLGAVMAGVKAMAKSDGSATNLTCSGKRSRRRPVLTPKRRKPLFSRFLRGPFSQVGEGVQANPGRTRRGDGSRQRAIAWL